MVSVSLASYNGEKYIKAQIDSILSQIAPEDELVISDDGSTDDTLEIIRSYKDSRIRLISNGSGRHGVTGNCINALLHTKGDPIFMADQDDVWLPGKYEKMLSCLEGYHLVHHDSIVTDDDLSPICDSLYSIKHNGPGVFKNMKKGSFYGSHMLITRSLLEYCIPFPENDEVGHDLWIGLVASMKARCNFIPDRFLYYRRHNGVHCELFEPSPRPLSRKLYSRLVMLKYILSFKARKYDIIP